MILSEIDLGRLTSERRRISTFPQIVPGTDESEKDAYQIIHFTFQQLEETTLTRHYERTPFVPNSKADRDRRCDEILHIQAMGLKKRLAHTHCTSAVIGISGGLELNAGSVSYCESL